MAAEIFRFELRGGLALRVQRLPPDMVNRFLIDAINAGHGMEAAVEIRSVAIQRSALVGVGSHSVGEDGEDGESLLARLESARTFAAYEAIAKRLHDTTQGEISQLLASRRPHDGGEAFTLPPSIDDEIEHAEALAAWEKWAAESPEAAAAAPEDRPVLEGPIMVVRELTVAEARDVAQSALRAHPSGGVEAFAAERQALYSLAMVQGPPLTARNRTFLEAAYQAVNDVTPGEVAAVFGKATRASR